LAGLARLTVARLAGLTRLAGLAVTARGCGLAERGRWLVGSRLAVLGLTVLGLAVLGWPVLGRSVLRRRVSGLPVAGLAERSGWLVGPRLAVPRLTRAGLGISALRGGSLTVAGLGGVWLAAEAQARQAVLRLVRSRTVLSLKTLLLKTLLLKSVLLRYGPGGVRSPGAVPLITRGRDYPGAFRCGGLILLSQAPGGGRLVTSRPVRLVLGRDGRPRTQVLRRLVPAPVLTFLHPYHLCPEVSLRCVVALMSGRLVARCSQGTSSKHYEPGRELKMP
jgi:hypothetical protein